MTAAAEASAIESRVGHYYQMDDTYLVGREKVREYARAVQDYHPAHWDVAAAAELGYSGLVAPLTFTSIPAMACNRRMFESVVVGYDTYLQTEEVFEQHRPIVAGDELHTRRRADVGAQDRRQRHDHRDQHLHRHGRRAGAHPAHHRCRRHRRGPRSGDQDRRAERDDARRGPPRNRRIRCRLPEDGAPRGRGSDRRGRHDPHATDAVLR